MQMLIVLGSSLCIAAVLLSGCAADNPGKMDKKSSSGPPKSAVELLREHQTAIARRTEEKIDTITVQHILISFKEAVGNQQQGLGATESFGDAEKLVAELRTRAEGGEDFGALVKQYSKDPGEGIYTMYATLPSDGKGYNRRGMVPAFGNVGWRLKAGEVGVAPYDPAQSPYGWHIIKRIK